MKCTILGWLIFFPVMAMAQYNVTIEIDSLPAILSGASIYIAGNFNNWEPRDPLSLLQKNEKGKYYISFPNAPALQYEIKFTRGSWENVETDKVGKDIANRIVTISSDTTLHFSIAGWKDGFAPGKQRPSTASHQVSIISTAFELPQLNRTRRLWVYLPKGYNSSRKSYPVLYMQDGQNLFEDSTAFAGEWGVDEALDSVKNACIVVGIDNGGKKRMNEYNPDDVQQFGLGEGRLYLAFLVKTLKPYIDSHYRTLTDMSHTWLCGSSMGGLISFYGGLYYPEVFGSLGIFSPAFWINPQLRSTLTALSRNKTISSQRYYFYAGARESDTMVKDMEAIGNELKHLVNPEIKLVVNPEGKHSESTWRGEFPAFYRWLAGAIAEQLQ